MKWYPAEKGGIRQCVYDDEYPDYYLTSYATFLFDDGTECCEAYHVCPEPAVTSTTATTTTASTATAKDEYWYPLIIDGSPSACVQDDNYPDQYLDPELKSSLLFDAQDDCCTSHPLACPAAEKWYPKVVEGAMVCVFGDDYPELYEEYPEGHLFESEEGCCGYYGVCEDTGGK